jgi:predicted amidophosphoribosyltransferase
VLARELIADLADLVLARSCVRCRRAGRALCGPCLLALRGHAGVHPMAAALPPVTCAVPYDPVGRALIVEYKEHGNRGLAPMLGVLLADAVSVHPPAGSARPCVLVRVPGRPRPVRGFDALGAVTGYAARELRARGLDVTAIAALRVRRRYPELKDLPGHARATAVAGVLAASPSVTRIPRTGSPFIVVVDDVVTTGSTVREAVRALRGEGVTVDAVAAVSAASRDR